jgi:hypothetical protein
MYYEEMRDGAWERIEISGEMLMGRAHHVIYFASPEQWHQYPAWARDRRDEIIARITSEFREPDYEYHGLRPAVSGVSTASVAPRPTAARPLGSKATPSQMRALLVAVLLLLAIAGFMGLLVATGVTREETYYPTKYSFLRRAVSREQEPGMYWASIGVYAAIGIGTLTLGALGLRAWRRLGR